MDRLTAIRSFAQPGFTPARRVRIEARKWYSVTFQNVERDPRCDYVGLGKGEYVQLLPGEKARQARDARLNHCNAIQEHAGSVFELFASSYGGELKSAGWFASELDATRAALASRESHDKWITDCETTLADYQRRYEDSPQSWLAGAIADCERVIRERRDAFKCEVKQVR